MPKTINVEMSWLDRLLTFGLLTVMTGALPGVYLAHLNDPNPNAHVPGEVVVLWLLWMWWTQTGTRRRAKKKQRQDLSPRRTQRSAEDDAAAVLRGPLRPPR